MKKIAIIAALLISSAALADETPAPPPTKTFSLSQKHAADYARRLQTEMQQLQAQYTADADALAELTKQAEEPKVDPKDKAKKEGK